MASKASGRIEAVDAQKTFFRKSKSYPGRRGGYLFLYLSYPPDLTFCWHSIQHGARRTVGTQAAFFPSHVNDQSCIALAFSTVPGA